MKLVVDQNCFRPPDTPLRTHLAAAPENFAVLTDTAVFEMLKGSDPLLTARKSSEILCDFPDQVIATAGTGELIRQEIATQAPIIAPDDDELTARTRALLREIKKHALGQRADFPLDAARIQREIGPAIAQRLDHALHKASLVGAVDVLRKQLPANIRQDAKRGRMTEELYTFVYQSGFVAFRDVMSAHGVPSEKTEALYLGYSLGARLTMLYQLSILGWFESGGAESLPAAAASNDFIDVDYVTISTYYDGVLSKENRVQSLYARAKLFFEFKRATSPRGCNDVACILPPPTLGRNRATSETS